MLQLVISFENMFMIRSDYNKIMLNFAVSLMFAFLTLIIVQRHSTDLFMSPLCVVLGHLNMFFFLATFFWMAIMSYVIFDQIHG